MKAELVSRRIKYLNTAADIPASSRRGNSSVSTQSDEKQDSDET